MEFKEIWKNVQFDFEYTNDYKLEVSNLGRLRSYNKLSDGNIVNGSMINGYRIVRLKFFKPRNPKTEAEIAALQQEVLHLSKHLKALQQSNAPMQETDEATQQLNELKKKLKRKFKAALKQRTMHYQALIHRLVAEYFCNKPSAEHTIVAHLDHNKLNNLSTNLKWMTPEENYLHQQKSPYVIEEKNERLTNPKFRPQNSKLTITKVMLLKKMLNEGKPIRTLVKHFKITDTQILRIKRGENWTNIPPAT